MTFRESPPFQRTFVLIIHLVPNRKLGGLSVKFQVPSCHDGPELSTQLKSRPTLSVVDCWTLEKHNAFYIMSYRGVGE